MDNNVTELIIKARNGDDSAFECLCNTYNALIDSMAKKYSEMYPDKNLVNEFKDDFLQEAKLAFYNAVLNFNISEGKVTFGAYAKTCIRNRLVSYLRKAGCKKRQKIISGDSIVGETPQDTVIQRELEKKLLTLAETVLSNYEMRILKMYVSGAKTKEISAKIGKNEKSVYNAIFRIRSKLKKQSNNGT